MKFRKWLKARWTEISIGDPNSVRGLRERAERLVDQGYSPDNPYVLTLLKQAELKEKEAKP